MLSNKHRYTLLRASRILLAPFYSLLALFLKKNDNIIITGSLNMEFSDNAKALFDLLVADHDFKNRVYYVINDKKKRNALNEIYPGKFISNLSIKEAFFVLKSRYWFCSAMELPLTSFFQRHIRQVTHLGHGMFYKRAGLIEAKSHWYKKLYYSLVTSSFTNTIATTEFCRKYISAGFNMAADRVLLMPQPKTLKVTRPDKINEPILQNKLATNILYAPTWRPYADVELFPFRDFDLNQFKVFLVENNIHIWLRVHPRFEQNIDENLKCENIHLFSGSIYPDINSYLAYFDALITDYSSIFYDYLILERPVLFFDYDFDIYNRLVGVIDEYYEVKTTQTTADIKDFKKQILEIKSAQFCLEKVKKANSLVNYQVVSEAAENIIVSNLF